MTIQSYEIRALDDFGGRIHWIPSDLGAWCPADSVRRLEADMEALKAELAALKAPPKVLSAEEIKWSGVYRWRDSEDAFQWDWVSVCEFRVDGKREFDMFRFGDNKIEKAWGQFIGPIKMREV